ncbi:MAG: hypothetical protein Q9181_002155 [Wetmoreana brouardii]
MNNSTISSFSPSSSPSPASPLSFRAPDSTPTVTVGGSVPAGQPSGRGDSEYVNITTIGAPFTVSGVGLYPAGQPTGSGDVFQQHVKGFPSTVKRDGSQPVHALIPMGSARKDLRGQSTFAGGERMVLRGGGSYDHGRRRNDDERSRSPYADGRDRYVDSWRPSAAQAAMGRATRTEREIEMTPAGVIKQMTTTLVPATIAIMTSNGVVKTITDPERNKITMRPETETETEHPRPIGIDLALDRQDSHTNKETVMTATVRPARRFLPENLQLPLSLARDIKDRLVNPSPDLMKAVIPRQVLYSFWQEHGYCTVPEWRLFFPEGVKETKEKKKGSEPPPSPPQEVEKAEPQPTPAAAVKTDVVPMEDAPLQGLEDDMLDIEGPDESLFIADDSALVSAVSASLEDTGLETTVTDPVFDKENNQVLPSSTGTSSDPVKVDEEVYFIEESSRWQEHDKHLGEPLWQIIVEYNITFESIPIQEKKDRKIVLGATDLISLYDREWLNDAVINGFLELVVNACPDTELVNSNVSYYCLEALKRSKVDGSKVDGSKVGGSKVGGSKVDESDLRKWGQVLRSQTRSLMIPLLVSTNHWALCVARWEDKQGHLQWYNSMPAYSSSTQPRVDLVRECLELLGRQNGSPLASISWRLSSVQGGIQRNSDNCGVFVCAHGVMAAFPQEWDGCIDGYRVHIAQQLLNALKQTFSVNQVKWLPLKPIRVHCAGALIGSQCLQTAHINESYGNNEESLHQLAGEQMCDISKDLQMPSDTDGDGELCGSFVQNIQTGSIVNKDQPQTASRDEGRRGQPLAEKCGPCIRNSRRCVKQGPGPCSNCRKEGDHCREQRPDDHEQAEQRRIRQKHHAKLYRQSRQPYHADWTPWSVASVKALAILNGYDPDLAYSQGGGTKAALTKFLVEKQRKDRLITAEEFPHPKVQPDENSEAQEECGKITDEYNNLPHDSNIQAAARQRGALIHDSGCRVFYIQWLRKDDLLRPTRNSLFLITMCWSSPRKGRTARQKAFDRMDESQRVFLEYREAQFPRQPPTIISRLLFVRSAQAPLPTLEDQSPWGTPKGALVRNLALMNEGACVVILIHGLDGATCKPEHWKTFYERWRHLDIYIEICARNYRDRLEGWEILPHRKMAGDRKWYTFKLETLVTSFDQALEDRDSHYQEWISEMSHDDNYRDELARGMSNALRILARPTRRNF